MLYDRKVQQQVDIHVFRLILSDYLICKEKNLTLVLVNLEKELVRRFNLITGMTVKIDDNKLPPFSP